ncbi:MAG: hypothetical protein LBM73_03780 [Candidatus Nomurabacteria bacterium]|jgi:hypothetical protein|nr:hypothetical protein [Candidatus Nomurabacteria bacterium]
MTLQDVKKYYKSSLNRISGAGYDDRQKKALAIYDVIKRSTHRKPYIRSKIFSGDKIFLDNFWPHFYQKRRPDRDRRIVFYAAALDLLSHSTLKPITKAGRVRGEKYHKLFGITANRYKFVVQVRENPRGGKYLMSIFPENVKNR